jgi:hypothetical protein
MKDFDKDNFLELKLLWKDDNFFLHDRSQIFIILAFEFEVQVRFLFF